MPSTKQKKKDDKKLIPIKVPQKVYKKFLQIQEETGFGNKAATFTFLVHQYNPEKTLYDIDKASEELDKVVDKIDWENMPSTEDQLSSI
jgi:hypothetical protein